MVKKSARKSSIQTMSTSKTAPSDLVSEIERREQELDTAQKRVEEFGEQSLQELADAHKEFIDLLDIYEDKVIGDEGDIKTNVEFQSQIAEITSSLSEDMLLYEVFEECDEYLQQRWFSQSDFDHVYEQFEPVSDLAARLDDRDEALEAYRETRRDITFRCRDLKEEINDLERLAALTDADLDAPTERLREPIDSYNEAVTDAFREFRKSASARDVVAFLDTMELYPLIEFESPPAEFVDYINNHPPGEEPIPTVLEYGEYSRSKLSHYVDEPEKLKHAIEHHRAYFDTLDASALRISWPPPTAAELRLRCQALTAAVNRFDPSVVEKLREVAALPRETDYERLRNSAVLKQDLTERERERLRSGEVAEELEAKREQYKRLQRALDEYPER